MAVPTPPTTPWTSSSFPRHSIHSLPLPVFEALETGDLKHASSLAPSSLPPLPSFLISLACRGVWRRRLDEIAADYANALWMARMIIYEGEVSQSSNAEVSNAVIVGRIGFHGYLDERGMVEVGYEIDEAHRKRGHARTALRIMVDIARAIDDVKVLRASVYEENWISRRVVEGEGLRYVGKEIHPRKGLQNVFEMDVSTGTV